jgi:hypothetical protein
MLFTNTSKVKRQFDTLSYHARNVIVREADQYRKRITPVRYFRVIIEILYNALSFLLIMPTYSEEDLTNALAAY